MPRFDPSHPYRSSYRGSPFGRRFSGLLPWMFVVGIAVAIVLTFRHGTNWPIPHADDGQSRDAEIVIQRAGHPDSREAVDVIRTTAIPFSRAFVRATAATSLSAFACAASMRPK